MKDLFPGTVARDEFQHWLNIGYGPFTIWQGEKALAMISSLEKTPTVTVQKAGEELSFKTGTSCLRGYRSSYSAYHIAAPDRREFERLFGRHSDYHVEDITRITYGKKTIYETAPVQAEEPVQEIGMGGMM